MSNNLDAATPAHADGAFRSSSSGVEAFHQDTHPMSTLHDTEITPSSKVTVGLLWTLLIGGLAVTGFFWSKFDALDDRFVTKELFNARMSALEKQIDRLETTIARQAPR